MFQGGFLGLDNIGPFNRSTLPVHGLLEQSDGTSWMAMYCQNLLELALVLAEHDRTYEDLATKFFEHFALIASALNDHGLWNEEDGFYYDRLRLDGGATVPLPARSVVGLLPLVAVTTIGPATMARLPDFQARTDWFMRHRPEAQHVVQHTESPAHAGWRMLSIVDEDRLRRLLGRMLDPDEFLSEHGLRALSKWHQEHPLQLDLGGVETTLDYEPAESTNALFGGNSNWRGPVWMPINYLLIEALRVYDRYLGAASASSTRPARAPSTTSREIADELTDAADLALPARRRRSPPGLRRLRAVAAGSGLARPAPVPRVLPRRHRSRPRRLAPDRLDGPRRRPDHPPAPGVSHGSRHGSSGGSSLRAAAGPQLPRR